LQLDEDDDDDQKKEEEGQTGPDVLVGLETPDDDVLALSIAVPQLGTADFTPQAPVSAAAADAASRES